MLHYFICGLHRYNARIDLDALVAYLVEDRQWPKAEAEIVRNHILIGAGILRVNSRFRG